MNRSRVPGGDDFVERWNALDRKDRLRIRRLVRLGRPVADREEARLAVAYARFQVSRPWTRFFWIWFVPGLVMAISVAGRLHPLFVGVVLALGAQAAYTRVNLDRVEDVNEAFLGPRPQKRRAARSRRSRRR